MTKFQPIIKWTGSKRALSDEIISYFPNEIETYYEPFCGGASILRALLESGIKCKEYVCSDLNDSLIELWRVIMIDPYMVCHEYDRMWCEMNSSDNEADKRTYYEAVRERFNKEKNPCDFMFLNRTCFNGLIRYNSDGVFNTSFHLNRKGIEPHKLTSIIMEWSDLLKKNNVKFLCCDHKSIQPRKGDLVFCDPPYADTGTMYYGGFDNQAMFEWLKGLECSWMLTYDGISGKTDNTYNVPIELYDKHVYIKSGNSSFNRIKEVSKDSFVYESLYIKN